MDQTPSRVTISIEGIESIEVDRPDATPMPQLLVGAPQTVQCYDAAEVARLIGYNEQSVRVMARTGAIPARKPNGTMGKLLFWHEDLVDWLRSLPPATGETDTP